MDHITVISFIYYYPQRTLFYFNTDIWRDLKMTFFHLPQGPLSLCRQRVKTASYFVKREKFANKVETRFGRAEIQTADLPAAVRALYPLDHGKLWRSNRSRAKFHFISWSNQLLINFFDPNSSSDLNRHDKNWFQRLKKWLKSLKSTERDQNCCLFNRK